MRRGTSAVKGGDWKRYMELEEQERRSGEDNRPGRSPRLGSMHDLLHEMEDREDNPKRTHDLPGQGHVRCSTATRHIPHGLIEAIDVTVGLHHGPVLSPLLLLLTMEFEAQGKRPREAQMKRVEGIDQEGPIESVDDWSLDMPGRHPLALEKK
uniref:Reverse transcriptase domain-containing protein n=1 Tax=Haemonchus contortus TaxID=6289 RepID=A0A7I4Z575_HAECO